MIALKALTFVLFWMWLRPLIAHNYRQRAAGILPDEWYWADLLALRWGYTVKLWSDK